MTLTSRLEAQHSLLLALHADMTDLRTDLRGEINGLRTELNDFRTEVRTETNDLKVRVTNLEDGMGKALWGITEIKNLLAPPEDPP